MAEAVAWVDAQGKFCCLQHRGACQDKRMAEPAPLLTEDALNSDTRGWSHNAEGAELARLCRYRDSVYRASRYKFRCGEPGRRRWG